MKKFLLFFFISLSFLAKGQKVPTSYPLFKVVSAITIYNSGLDSTIDTYVYDSLHRLKTHTYSVCYWRSAWQVQSIDSQSYDSGGAYTSVKTCNYNPAEKQFIPQSAYEARYDSLGNLVYHISGYYSGEKLIYQSFNNNVYDSSGNQILNTTFDTISKIGTRDYYRYNKAGEKIADSTLILDMMTNQWSNFGLEYWQKNTLGQDTCVVSIAWSGLAWQNVYKNINIYDTMHRGKKHFYLEWNTNTNLWDSNQFDLRVDSILKWTIYTSQWIGGLKHWGPESITTNIGTAKKYCSSLVKWDGSSYHSIAGLYPECSIYDSAGNILSAYSGTVGLGYDGFDNEWIYDSIERIKFYSYSDEGGNGQTLYYYYPNTRMGIITSAKPAHDISIYPNPSTGKYSVSFSQDFSGTLEVYDLLGKAIYQQKVSGNNEIRFQIDALFGIYLLKITDTNGLSEIRKIVKY